MRYLIVLLVSVMLTSCGSSTHITGSWIDPKVPSPKFDKVLVIALVQNESTRRIIEDHVASYSPKFMTSFNSLPTKASFENEEVIKSVVSKNNVDAVLTYKLVDKTTEESYVSGSYTPYYPYYGGLGFYGGYYPMMYNNFYTPGYYTQSTYYFVEVNVFNVESNKLVWSGITKSYEPHNIEKVIDDISQAAIERMKQDGLVY